MKNLDLILGLYDDPENQTQQDYSVDLCQSNLAIFGATMSGKTTLLKTILLRIHQVLGATMGEEIYILDFSNDLTEYRSLPYVRAYFESSGSKEENVRRIFRVVEEKLSENVKNLPGKKFTDVETDNDAPPHITFILDGLNAFMSEERFSAYHESLQKIARDGLSKGVSVIFTANDLSGGIMRLMDSFKSRIAFDLPKDKYSDLFSSRVQKPIVLPGRGVVNVKTNCYEFQSYLPYNVDESTEVSALAEIKSDISKSDNGLEILKKCGELKLQSFSGDLLESDLSEPDWDKVSLREFPPIFSRQGWREFETLRKSMVLPFTAGLDYYSLKPVCFDLRKANSIAIYGRKEFGKSNLLSRIVACLMSQENTRFIFWEDGRHGLAPIQEYIDRLISTNPTEDEKRKGKKNVITVCYDQAEFEKALERECLIHLPDDIDLSERPDEREKREEMETKRRKLISDGDFCVIVVQSRHFYVTTRKGGDGSQIISRLSPYIKSDSTLFIFSDVQRIASSAVRTYFNNEIAHAFLFDDILRFVKGKGQYSVFENQDPIELKELFGLCEIGDGFYFNIEKESLTKLKFIKAERGT